MSKTELSGGEMASQSQPCGDGAQPILPPASEPSGPEGESELGKITWLSSEEGGGPDVGLILGLGGGSSLYVGEVSNAKLEEQGVARMEGVGWHIALHRKDGFQIVGAVTETLAAQEMIEMLFAAIRSWKS